MEAQTLEPTLVRAGPGQRRSALLPPCIAPRSCSLEAGRPWSSVTQAGGRLAGRTGRSAAWGSDPLLLHGFGGRTTGSEALCRYKRGVSTVDNSHIGYYQSVEGWLENGGDQGGTDESSESHVVIVFGCGSAVAIAVASGGDEGESDGDRG